MISHMRNESTELLETERMAPATAVNYGLMPGRYEYVDRGLIEKLEGDSKGKKIDSYVKLIMVIIFVTLVVSLFAYLERELKSVHRVKKMETTEAPQVCTRTAADDYIGEDVEIVAAEMEAMGFKDIKLIPKADLKIGLLKKQGEVVRVSVAGNPDFEPGEIYDENDTVIIMYHDFK